MGARRSDLTQGDEHRVGEKWHSGCILKAGANSVAYWGLWGSQRTQRSPGQLQGFWSK